MSSPGFFLSLVMQMSRMMTGPARRARDFREKHRERARGRRIWAASRAGCGKCPKCGAFVLVEFPEGSGIAPCPGCGRAIRRLESPG
jgi:hypothetical protein